MNKSKYINFLFLLVLFSSCSLTKGLKEGEYLLYDIEVKGNNLTNKNDLLNLARQEPNTRIPLLNTSIGVSLYRFGEWTYDSLKPFEKKAKYEKERLELLQMEASSEGLNRKQRKRLNKVNNIITSLNKKLEFGNFFMRTGNPRVILDLTKTEESRRQMANFLLNNGFFDAETNFEVYTKNKRAYVH